MAGYQMFGHPKLATYASHFILEEPTQWLAEFQLHLLGQPANIVVTFYNLSRNIHTFDAIGINSTLCQPLHTIYFFGLLLKHFN